jgi:hypothetical protein
MPAKILLTASGLLYLALALYCVIAPQKASETVHLERIGVGGKSEFMVIYGGLELAMAVLFLLPWTGLLSDKQGLYVFLVIHAILVLFRTISIFAFGALPASTTKLAIGEWVLLIAGLLVLWLA